MTCIIELLITHAGDKGQNPKGILKLLLSNKSRGDWRQVTRIEQWFTSCGVRHTVGQCHV